MSIHRWHNGGYYDVGFVTSDMRFHYAMFAFPRAAATIRYSISRGCESVLNAFFEKNRLTAATRILLCGVDETVPIATYLKIAAKFAKFKIVRRDMAKMLNCIIYANRKAFPWICYAGTSRMRCRVNNATL